MDISIIIPTYNEKENIVRLIPEIEVVISSTGKSFEIVVVDDSSPDGTGQAALNLPYNNIRVITREKKEGIGAAIRHGYNEALGEIIISTDADLAFPPKDMLRFLEKLESVDLVVGSRYNGGQYEIRNARTLIKGTISKVGNKVVRAVSGVPITDFSANFRAIKKSVWQEINTKEKTNSILLEMIMKTKYKGYQVDEIQVTFTDRRFGESKLNLAAEAPKFFAKLCALAWKLRVLKDND